MVENSQGDERETHNHIHLHTHSHVHTHTYNNELTEDISIRFLARAKKRVDVFLVLLPKAEGEKPAQHQVPITIDTGLRETKTLSIIQTAHSG